MKPAAVAAADTSVDKAATLAELAASGAVEEASVSQVKEWVALELQSRRVDQAKAAAAAAILFQQDIDGEELLKLTKDDMVALYKISGGIAGKIMDAVEALGPSRLLVRAG